MILSWSNTHKLVIIFWVKFIWNYHSAMLLSEYVSIRISARWWRPYSCWKTFFATLSIVFRYFMCQRGFQVEFYLFLQITLCSFGWQYDILAIVVIHIFSSGKWLHIYFFHNNAFDSGELLTSTFICFPLNSRRYYPSTGLLFGCFFFILLIFTC